MEKAYEIIRNRLVSEKGTLYLSLIITFSRFLQNLIKIEIKQAVEKLFNVKVLSVNTLNQNGKVKKFRNIKGKDQILKKRLLNWLKAIQSTLLLR